MIPLPKYEAKRTETRARDYVNIYCDGVWVDFEVVPRPLDHTTFTLEDCR